MKYLTIDEIKQVIEFFNDENMEEVAKILNNPSFNVNLDELSDEKLEKLEENFYKAVAEKINENDFDVILEDEEISRFDLEYLIVATDNSELIKKGIQTLKGKCNESEIKDLILATKDNEFMYETLINSQEYNIGYYSMNEILITANGEKYDYEKYGDKSFIDLIVEKGNIELIKKVVYGNSSLDYYHKKELIIATKNPKFIKECIENPCCDWRQSELRDLIIATNEPSYIEEIINNKKVPNFEVELVVATKDEDYIKTLLQDEHRSNKVEILIRTKNIKLIEECIKDNEENNYGLSIYNLESLLTEIDDVEFIVEIIKNNKELDSKTIRNHLKKNIEKSINTEKKNEDIPYIKECLMKMFELNSEVVDKIDFAILDTKYIEKLGLEKINQISCYPDIQERIFRLSDSQLEIFSECIEHCNIERWTPLAQAFLENINQYDELIIDIIQSDGKK